MNIKLSYIQKKIDYSINSNGNTDSIFKKNFKRFIRKKIFKNNNFYLFNLKDENQKNLIKKTNFIAGLIGKQVSQNKKGEKNIFVTPNINKINKFKGKIKENLRYHQTNLGGSIHTDGPQMKIPPKFVIMTCLHNSKTGGESILVNGEKIFKHIKKNKLNFFNKLNEKVFFERRGFKKTKNYIFKKSIFNTYKKRFLYIRYLKDYIISAYKIKKINLCSNLKSSLTYLDSCLENKKFQKKYKMQVGDIIIINNHKMAHGRMSFSINKNNQRKILRVWVN